MALRRSCTTSALYEEPHYARFDVSRVSDMQVAAQRRTVEKSWASSGTTSGTGLCGDMSCCSHHPLGSGCAELSSGQAGRVYRLADFVGRARTKD